DVMQRSTSAESGQIAAGLVEKRRVLGWVHLARRHREGVVMDRAEAARVTVDRHVVGRVAEDHRGARRAHQRGEGAGVESVAAQNAMSPKKPQISNFADQWRHRKLGYDVGWVGT